MRLCSSSVEGWTYIGRVLQQYTVAILSLSMNIVAYGPRLGALHLVPLCIVACASRT